MENDRKKTIQCLVGWKSFYSDTSVEKYPSVLCFPEFFIHAIHNAKRAIMKMENIIHITEEIKKSSNGSNSNDNSNSILQKKYNDAVKFQFCIIEQIKRFFSSLQIMIDLLFLDDIIRVKPFDNAIIDELISAVREEMTTGKTMSEDFYFLEKYLVEEKDKLNYQNALLQTSLKYYNANSVERLIEILYKEGSCENIDQTPVPQIPIPSIHYAHQIRFSNATPISNDRLGPRGWGPIFWNIFHALSQNAPKMILSSSSSSLDGARNRYYKEDEISTFLYGYIQYLPQLIPCIICSIHFYETIHPGSIPYSDSVNGYRNLYYKIHKRVTEKIEAT